MLLLALQAIFYQVITVNQTEACFMNFTAGHRMWEQCGIREDFLQFALLPWEWATGGNFSMILVSVMVLFSYIKYHKVLYPVMIGVLFLPVTFFVFPDTFLSYAFILGFGLVGGIVVWYVITHQTKEYG